MNKNINELVIEQAVDKQSKKVRDSIKLRACNDANIYLSLPTATYRLLHNDLVVISGVSFLYLQVDKDSNSKLLFPIKDTDINKVKDFFNYWSKDKLSEMKMENWNSFCEFWITVFDFVRDNINLEDNKVTYEFHSDHYDDRTGYVFNNFDIHLGEEYFGSKEELGEQYYDHYIDLTNKLQGELIDKYFQDDLGISWVSEFPISFRP